MARRYPGNDQVDLLCADAYTPYSDEPLEDVLAPFVRWARTEAPEVPSSSASSAPAWVNLARERGGSTT